MPSSNKKAIKQIFTPRLSDVNNYMYIHRPELEKYFLQRLDDNRHVIVSGESGGGKSWLYKKMLNDDGIHYETLNCGDAQRFGSITEALQKLTDSIGQPRQTGYQDTLGAKANVGVAGVDSNRKTEFEIPQKDPFESVLFLISASSNSQGGILVLDNFEQIIKSKELMSELASLIVLLDDKRYARYGVKLLIVGVPSNIRDYFSQISNLSTLTNRLIELPEVSRLDQSQVGEFVERGFVEELRIDIRQPILARWKYHVYWVAAGIPQKVQEYCLELAYCLEDNDWVATDDLLSKADLRWLQTNQSASSHVVAAAMNEYSTRVQRRNQVLYLIGHHENTTFSAPQIERLIHDHFPSTVKGSNPLGISTILNYLAGDEQGDKALVQPIVQRVPRSNSYRFADPVYAMCIRVMLKKGESGNIYLQ